MLSLPAPGRVWAAPGAPAARPGGADGRGWVSCSAAGPTLFLLFFGPKRMIESDREGGQHERDSLPTGEDPSKVKEGPTEPLGAGVTF